MNAKIFYAALSTIVYKINYKKINTYEITRPKKYNKVLKVNQERIKNKLRELSFRL
jgi:hypothetical protein